MRKIRWFHVLGIGFVLLALGALVYWVFRAGGLLSKLSRKTGQESHSSQDTDSSKDR
ncbi:MAG TPA: hypothetical protein VN285_12125 [Candidatus Deferrimicrobium sp.]|nr:hypothetical protein [Candidatus Deferrimicrobium sp.]